MRAIYITRHGGPEVLEVREAPDPAPRPGEVRVRVSASGLNFADVMARQGLYPDAPKPPCVMGYEVAGTVDAVGSGVRSLAPGARVVAMPRFGGHADVVCVPEQQARALPEGVPFDEAAALPVNYLTAYHMVRHVAPVRPGARVLVHMAAGGVGLAVIQLLRLVPEVTVFGTASAGKHPFLREAGVTHPIDYRSTDYAAEVRRLTGGRGLDLVLDPLGGRDWSRGYELLAPAGHLVAYGFANMASGPKRSLARVVSQFVQVPRWSPLTLMDDNKSVSGVNMGHLFGETELLRAELDALIALHTEGKIKPHIDARFPFAHITDAHARLESRQNVGKVILTPT